ncbi:hypothetical protein SAMN05192575_107150 [Nocardioides alpinus]|uniref:Uncharacterized protein n=1 Tax=Nocardioides alpinus TaxID=748909 RepID=A0A1I1A2C8_9ACTN|nr:hypothetical protein [Nocardioides alpinus]PKH42157.1 hypothetical protein CXG46_06685 [Nocardioides alpinus]SFB32027.1 hypothetical protein SAMN05192575_107150 [Nocardioides alpinus]
MTSDDNRAPENLLLMCIAHSYEIDTDESRFPATLLQDWRAEQVREYEEFRQGWVLSEAQVAEVIELSFGSPVIAAPVITGIVEAVEVAALRAMSTRSGPEAAAAAWRTYRNHIRGSGAGRDPATGEILYAEPGRADRDRYADTVRDQLNAVRAVLEPLTDDVQAKTATARHTNPATAPWCGWVTRSAAELLAAASNWPWAPPYEDNDRLNEAVAELRASASALAAALRGEIPASAPGPPAEPEPDPVAVAFEDAKARHLETLERARAYAFVEGNPYNPALRAEIADAAGDVVLIWPVWYVLEYRLDTAARVAATLTKNATDAEVAAAITEDTARRPLAAATALLAELWREMSDTGRTDLADQARDALLTELRRHDWSSKEGWIDNTINGRPTFDYWTHWTTPGEPRTVLTDALLASPERLEDIVRVGGEWIQHQPSFGEPGPISAVLEYRDNLPTWFPTEAVVTTAAIRYPHVVPAISKFDRGAGPEAPPIEGLIAHVLRLANETEAS